MNKNLGKIDFRTDLAIECHECYENSEIDGVIVTNCMYENNEITKSEVEIINGVGEAMLGKPVGKYITIEARRLKDGNVNIHNKVVELFVQTMRDLCDFDSVKTILVVGLGNLYVTPDSLGQKVVQKLLVTRHFHDKLTEEYDGIRNVSAIAPGVMGQTGIETSHIVKAIAREIDADLVIAIDALCARNIDRLNQTIQICNTGIAPGGGVNNHRASINEEFIGSKVISIGVPTVIDSKMLIQDALWNVFSEEEEKSMNIDLSSNVKDDIIHEVLEKSLNGMFVSTKEIDELIVRLSGIIARGLNKAIHYDLSDEDITCLLY